jgi:hypothetical protein
MATFNEILEGRFNNALKKVFSMKGRAPTPQLAGEFVPVIPFFWGREARFLEGWQSFAFSTVVGAGGAGNISTVRFNNPVGSKTAIIVEKVALHNQTAAAQQWVWTENAAQANLVNVNLGFINLDSRSGPHPGQGPTLQISSKNNSAVAPSGSAFINLILPINTVYDYIGTDIQEVALMPNTSWDIGSLSTNVSLTMWMLWRERQFTDSELF